jgi:hypothetical protein
MEIVKVDRLRAPAVRFRHCAHDCEAEAGPALAVARRVEALEQPRRGGGIHPRALIDHE